MNLLYKVYPQIRGRDFTKEDQNLILEDAESQLEKHKSLSKKMCMIYKLLGSNHFNKFSSNDPLENLLYEKFKDDPEKILEEKIKCDKKDYYL